MAPESIDGQPTDERSDVFSMGTVLYWLATGSLPFEALTPHALLKQIADGRLTPPQQKSPRVSDDLARVIARALQTKPADRYQTAREFGDALRELLDRAGLRADSGVVRATLAAPDAEITKLQAIVRATFLERARKHLDDGQTARALGCLNRVLADDANDADARVMLDQLHDEDEEPTAAHPEDDAPSQALSLAAGAPLAEPPLTSATPSLRWQSLFVGALAVLLIGAAVAVSRAVDDASAPKDDVVAVVPPPKPNPDLAPPVDDPGSFSAGTPATFGEPVDDSPGGRRRRPLQGLLVKAPIDQPPPDSVKKASPLPDGATPTPPSGDASTRRVTFRVKPWADIVVDGVTVATGTLAHEADLAEGPHLVVFKNPRAKEHEVRFTVTKDGPPPLIAARLEPKPAMLVVRANVADAFVDVGGVGKAAGDTVARPLVVSLDEQSKSEREVFVYKKGFQAYRRRHTFIAGETLDVNVVLQPDAGDPDPAPAPAP